MNQTLVGEIYHFFFLKYRYDTIVLYAFLLNQKRTGLKNNFRIPLKVRKSRISVVWRNIIKRRCNEIKYSKKSGVLTI